MNKLSYTVIDTTTSSKDVTHQTAHLYSILWTIEKKAATSTVNLKNEIKLQVSPNPTSGVVQVEYDLAKTANIRFTIFDQQGKSLKTLVRNNQISGAHTEGVDLSDLANGLYFIQIMIDNQAVIDKIQVLT